MMLNAKQICTTAITTMGMIGNISSCSNANKPVVAEQPTSKIIYEHGLDLYLHGHYKEALEKFNQVMLLDPKNEYAYLGRGNVWVRLGDNKRALTEYNFKDKSKLYVCI